VLFAIIGIVACTGCFGKARNGPAGSVGYDDVVLSIDNRNWSDVTVWVVHDGTRSRLGRVSSAAKSVLRIPTHFIGQNGAIRLVAEPQFSRSSADIPVSTEPLVVKTGARVVWTLAPDLRHSSVQIH
jgi:hypothetical protein